MEKEKEEIMGKMQDVRNSATNDLREEGSNASVVQNVKYYGKISLVRKEDKEPVEFELYTVEEYDYETDTVKTRIYLDGQEADLGELMRDYESLDPINDTLQLAKLEQTKEPEERKLEIYDLNELETEKEVDDYAKTAGVDKKDLKRVAEIKKEEEKEKTQEGEEVDKRKLESVTHLQEIKGHTKVNNHQTLEQALGMTGVKKFVVIYSEDTTTIARNNGEEKNRNHSRYSMIAVMNDGTAINLDNVLEPSRSEGTNSIEARTQTDADGTTKKEYHSASIYNVKGTNKALSLENDQYGEIQVYYGAMTRGAFENEGNQFVGTQLETRNVWPTSKEVREQQNNRAGEYHTDEKAAETRGHFEHGDEEIEDIRNADGREETIAECETINIDLIEKTVAEIMENETIELNYTEREVREALMDAIEKHPEMKPDEMKKYVEADLDRAAPERKR